MALLSGSARFTGAGALKVDAQVHLSKQFADVVFAGAGTLVAQSRLLSRARFDGFGRLDVDTIQRLQGKAKFGAFTTLAVDATRLWTAARFTAAGSFITRAGGTHKRLVAFQSDTFQLDTFQAGEPLVADDLYNGHPWFDVPTLIVQEVCNVPPFAITAAVSVEVAVVSGPTFPNIMLDAEAETVPPEYISFRVFDRHMRRDGDAYAEGFMRLFPDGIAWPKWNKDSIFVQTVNSLAQYWGFVDSRAADLLERESDPRQTVELLPEWERAFGLPPECFEERQSITERQQFLVFWMTLIGGQSRAFFIEASTWVGHDIRIVEYAPFMCGVSRAGDTRNTAGVYRWRIGPPEMRFYWTVHADQAKLTWFRATSGQAGVDHHLEISVFSDLDCLLNKWKPAQTELVFDYSSLITGGPMAGTP